MTFKLQKFLLIVLFQIILIQSLNINPFDKEKNKIEDKINQMRLGNYLRKLMLKNSELLSNEYVFLDHEDFTIGNDDLNFANLKVEDSDDEFRARIFSYKWVKQTLGSTTLKPFTLSKGTEDLDDYWKNYNVLLIGKKGETKLTKVCFPANIRDNFAIVTSINDQCLPKIKKIREYKILETKKNIFEDKQEYKIPQHKTKKRKPKNEKKEKIRVKYDKIIDDLFQENNNNKKRGNLVKDKKQNKNADNINKGGNDIGEIKHNKNGNNHPENKSKLPKMDTVINSSIHDRTVPNNQLSNNLKESSGDQEDELHNDHRLEEATFTVKPTKMENESKETEKNKSDLIKNRRNQLDIKKSEHIENTVEKKYNVIQQNTQKSKNMELDDLKFMDDK